MINAAQQAYLRYCCAFVVTFCLILLGASTRAPNAQSYPFWKVEPLISARLIEPTGRYPHGVLGDSIEYGALELKYMAGFETTIRLPADRVFEDIEARRIDIDGDGKLEVLIVESHRDKGARLAIYTGNGLMAATPYIGRRFRWLAPIGAADFDGDGAMDIAYIDRPHLAKTLRVWTYRNGGLTQTAMAQGLTNHKIGQDYISGGVRNCTGTPEMITLNANFSQIMATTLSDETLISAVIAPYLGKQSIDDALKC